MNISAINFKGVEKVGSVMSDGTGFNKLNNIINSAKTRETELKAEGKDVFVVPISTLDYKGDVSGKVATYVLTEDEARTMKPFDKAIERLENLFKDFEHSDLFDKALNKQINLIKSTQMQIAEFIAENRKKSS